MVEVEILNVDYNKYVEMLGTAHFTKRSLSEAYEAVAKLKPTDLAVELDLHRFQFLNLRCATCKRRPSCEGRCEFVGAADALGNVDANIWLIDMSEEEISNRIRRLLPASWQWWTCLVGFPFWRRDIDETELWERGLKDEVLDRHSRRLKALRAKAPHVWRVLIDERNALMAARLGWIVTQKLNKGEGAKVLALTGAAHVEGVKELLSSPDRIKEDMGRLGLRFTIPTLIRRVSVN